jgi:hypothetical protein
MCFLRISGTFQAETLFHLPADSSPCETFARDFIPGFLAPFDQERTHLLFLDHDETLLKMTGILGKYCADHHLTYLCTYTNFIYDKISISCLSLPSQLLEEAQKTTAVFKKTLNNVGSGIVLTCFHCKKEHAIKVKSKVYLVMGELMSPPLTPLDGAMPLT